MGQMVATLVMVEVWVVLPSVLFQSNEALVDSVYRDSGSGGLPGWCKCCDTSDVVVPGCPCSVALALSILAVSPM